MWVICRYGYHWLWSQNTVPDEVSAPLLFQNQPPLGSRSKENGRSGSEAMKQMQTLTQLCKKCQNAGHHAPLSREPALAHCTFKHPSYYRRIINHSSSAPCHLLCKLSYTSKLPLGSADTTTTTIAMLSPDTHVQLSEWFLGN